MDIAIPILFFIMAFICFIYALYEERDSKNSDEEEERSDNLCVILLTFSMIFWFIAGVCMMSVTETYYSVTTDTLEIMWMEYQRPVGWIGGIMGMFVLYLLVKKVFGTIDLSTEEE